MDAEPIDAPDASDVQFAPMPVPVRLAIGVLGVILIIQIIVGLASRETALLVSVLISALLMAGLALRHRWAYIATMVFCVLGVLALAAQGKVPAALGALVVNSCVAVPLALGTRWYFRR